jgi:hypothetical protein
MFDVEEGLERRGNKTGVPRAPPGPQGIAKKKRRGGGGTGEGKGEGKGGERVSREINTSAQSLLCLLLGAGVHLRAEIPQVVGILETLDTCAIPHQRESHTLHVVSGVKQVAGEEPHILPLHLCHQAPVPKQKTCQVPQKERGRPQGIAKKKKERQRREKREREK